MRDYTDICYCLAVMSHAANLLQQLAQTGKCNHDDFLNLRQTVLIFDANSVAELYGGRQGLQTSLRSLRTLLQSTKQQRQQQLQISQYVLGGLHLARHLRKDQTLQRAVLNGLKRIANYEQTSDRIVPQLAKLYSNTFGQLNYRIVIQGKKHYLQNPEIAAQCRCLLFASIRAGILFYQVGGRQWQLLFKRKQLRQLTHQLLLAN